MSNSFDTIEMISSALVREYLSTKGFLATLKHMDIEYPRCNQSINSRQTLARSLGFRRPSRGQGAILESLVRRLLIQNSITAYPCKETVANSDICSSTYNFPPQPCCDVSTQDKENIVTNEEKIKEALILKQKVPASFDGQEKYDSQNLFIKTDNFIVDKPVEDNFLLQSNCTDKIQETLSLISDCDSININSKIEDTHESQYPKCLSPLQINGAEIDRNDLLEEMPESMLTNNETLTSNIQENEVPLSTKVNYCKVVKVNNIDDKSSKIINKVKEIQNNLLSNKHIEKESSILKTDFSQLKNTALENIASRDDDAIQNNTEFPVHVEFELDMNGGKAGSLISSPLLAPPVPDGATPLALPAALQLKTLIFGDAEAQFPSVWREEGIRFNKNPKLGYGLELYKDGPCGALAALQGFVLKALLFCKTGQIPSVNTAASLDPDADTARCALVAAVSDVLWQCGQRRQACLAIPASEGGALLAGNGRYRRDGVTEALRLLHLDSLDDVRDAVDRHLSLLQDPGGCALFLCSAVLSRGLTKTAEDMGDACAPLLVRGGECAPELVSLVLTGRASMRDEKQGDERLRNVPARADIGLLTLAEYYGHCQVGSFLKTPRYPIWLVLAQGRYSVLFSTRRQLVSDWRAELSFRLHLYTGTAQRRPLQLSVETGGHNSEEVEDERTLSPVEMVIRTKWTGAMMQWIDPTGDK